MPDYTCLKCNLVFKTKGDYKRHENRKYPCNNIEFSKIKNLNVEKLKEMLLVEYLNKQSDIYLQKLQKEEYNNTSKILSDLIEDMLDKKLEKKIEEYLKNSNK